MLYRTEPLSHYYYYIIIIIIVVIIAIIIQSYGFIVILKDHDKTSLNHSSSSSFSLHLVSSCEYTEHLNRNVRRMDESKETFACSQV